jgi:hypothetical protein
MYNGYEKSKDYWVILLILFPFLKAHKVLIPEVQNNSQFHNWTDHKSRQLLGKIFVWTDWSWSSLSKNTGLPLLMMDSIVDLITMHMKVFQF